MTQQRKHGRENAAGPVRLSYHMHSQWSDGQSTVREMIAAARDLGLREVGISDHLVVPPPSSPDVEWSMRLDDLTGYVQDVQSAAAETDMTVRLGIEVDYFPETWRQMHDRLDAYAFDYVIGAVHFVDGFAVDEDGDRWDRLSQRGIDDTMRRYYERVAEAVDSGLFDILAHLDLPKKFGHRASCDLSRQVDAAIAVLAESGRSTEINSAGWDKPCGEAYPAFDLLAACAERGVPILISDDAHAPDQIGRHYERAVALARRAGYRETVRWAGRRPVAVPLS